MKNHLIMIVADQLRYDVLGKGYTPHIDQLASESICFDNAYCASPLCVPARGTLFTGLCPNSNGSLINPWEEADQAAGYVHEGFDNLYLMMERNGFDCIHTGKQHLFTAGTRLEERSDSKTRWLTTEQTYRQFLQDNGKRMPGGARFRSPVPEILGRQTTFCTSCSNASVGCYEEGEDYYFDAYFTDMARKGIRERDPSLPLFLSAMFLAPHPPFDIPEPWYSRYSPEDFTLPDNVGTWYPHQSPLQLYNVTGMLGSHYTREEWLQSWRVYLGLVSMLDDCVGALISELKEQGIYEDCLILFTSDHGEMLGSHRLFQKMCMYEESARVPLYIRVPGIAGRHVQQAVSHMDVLPTLCHYLGLACRHEMEGHSLHDLASEADSTCSRPIFLQYDGNSCLSAYQRCVVQDGYKLIMDVFQNEVFFELYHVASDPQEQKNLLFDGNHTKKAEQLYQLLCDHMELTGDALRPSPTALMDFLL